MVGSRDIFRAKRGDTLVATIEERYGIDLNARGDTLLRTLLRERGFDSQSQLLDAFFGKLTKHARKRRLFISFHKEDAPQLNGFNLMARNPRVALDFYNNSLRDSINSERRGYVKRVIRELINRASILICLIGNGTAWREWVEWELDTALKLHKGICGVRIPGTYGRIPHALSQVGAPIADWDTPSIIRTIERAAAKRS